MILLDSSVLIDFFRKKDKEKTFFFELTKNYKDMSISSISFYEVGIGNRKSHFDYWNELTEYLTVLSSDKACSQSAIEIYQNLLKKKSVN